MPTPPKSALCASAAAVLATLVALTWGGSSRGQTNGEERDDTRPAAGEFHFARMIYQDRAGYGGGFFRRGRGRGWWQQDWPAADTHFTQAIRRLTRIDAGEYVEVDLHDGRLFEYPWLYATQAGFWDLSDDEIAMLREYLLRGGFFVTDDFWEDAEWEVFREAMGRLFPEYPIVEITGGNAEVLHVLYDIDEVTQIPGLRHLARFDPRVGKIIGLPEPRWRGIYDAKGRLLVAANFNQDVGDAWEHADWPEYPEPMTTLAYRFGINYIVYSMTH